VSIEPQLKEIGVRKGAIQLKPFNCKYNNLQKGKAFQTADKATAVIQRGAEVIAGNIPARPPQLLFETEPVDLNVLKVLPGKGCFAL
jgi:hypothetical protein